MTRDDCVALDASDLLAPHRDAFALPHGIVYLDGNSLGALPHAARERVLQVLVHEWGEGLIRSWNAARWIDLPQRVGAKIAQLIGAHPNEVICADSTSINLFKVLSTALRLQASRPQVSVRQRNVLVSEKANFPTDLYVADGLIDLLSQGHELKLVEFDEAAHAIDDRTAVVMLTHVNYKTGAMHDMAAVTQRAHGSGALMVWDLSHSTGAVPVALNSAAADFAVGCGYKYLNGGPGAPAFVFVARRHLAAIADDAFAQPLAGWLGHHAPFEFVTQYRPAASIDRYAVGTPSIVAMSALEVGVDTVLAAGIDALRAKSIALTQLFIELVEQHCADQGLSLASPRDAEQRGSQVCFSHAHAYAVMQALIKRGVIGDFRAPDILRFGFAPLYVGYVDVWDAMQALHHVLAEHEWQRAEFQTREAVT
ncbi:MAG TPA: kynureninase [Burkholderiaceae bacterium]|nr:kynureninase [Burkholderiaceae bacterium]